MKVKTRLAMIPILVGDQEGALHFYTEKLGLEKRSDLSFGPGLRLLTVAPRGQRRPEIALVQPDMLVTSMGIPAQQGAQKVCWVFRTDDCRHMYEIWKARGVTFLNDPTQQVYGIEARFVDPYGNIFALLEPSRKARALLGERILGIAA
jgi:predicted enzyme related to lactoylglutathione lyase